MHFTRAFIPYKEAKANFFLRLLELVQLEKTKNKLHFFFLNQQDKTIYATSSTSLKKIKKKKTKMKDISSNNIRFIVCTHV